MDRRRLAPALLLAGALAPLAGCGGGAQAAPEVAPAPAPSAAGEAGEGDAPDEKARQCDALIDVINRGIRELARIEQDPSDPTGVRDLLAMASALEDVAVTTSKVRLTIPELQRASKEYREMALGGAKAARDMAAAARAQDGEAITAAQEALQSAVVREDPLVDGLNDFCKAF